MAQNRGKQFEDVVREALERVPGVSVDRLHDQTNGYLGSSNICDFIVYKRPFELYLECKSVHGNTFSIHGTDEKHKYGNITNKQWEGLLEKSKIKGVVAGVLIWWVDKDVTRFVTIQSLQRIREHEFNSIRYDADVVQGEYLYTLKGKKKRVFFDYDMEDFLGYLKHTDILRCLNQLQQEAHNERV